MGEGTFNWDRMSHFIVISPTLTSAEPFALCTTTLGRGCKNKVNVSEYQYNVLTARPE